MKPSEKIRTALRMTDRAMSEWTNLATAEVSRIKPTEDRSRRLDEIRSDMDTYFVAEMDSRFRDGSPLTYDALLALVDEWFIELGIMDMPQRERALKKPPWQKEENKVKS